MKKCIRVRVEIIDAKEGPEDPAIEERETFYFFPRSGVFWTMMHLAKYIASIKKRLERQ